MQPKTELCMFPELLLSHGGSSMKKNYLEICDVTLTSGAGVLDWNSKNGTLTFIFVSNNQPVNVKLVGIASIEYFSRAW